MNINYDDMLAQVKENIKKVEEEGQSEARLAFTSARAQSDIFYKIVEDLDGWVIKACDSRAVPAHYVNNCVLERVDAKDEKAEKAEV